MGGTHFLFLALLKIYTSGVFLEATLKVDPCAYIDIFKTYL